MNTRYSSNIAFPLGFGLTIVWALSSCNGDNASVQDGSPDLPLGDVAVMRDTKGPDLPRGMDSAGGAMTTGGAGGGTTSRGGSGGNSGRGDIDAGLTSPAGTGGHVGTGGVGTGGVPSSGGRSSGGNTGRGGTTTTPFTSLDAAVRPDGDNPIGIDGYSRPDGSGGVGDVPLPSDVFQNRDLFPDSLLPFCPADMLSTACSTNNPDRAACVDPSTKVVCTCQDDDVWNCGQGSCSRLPFAGVPCESVLYRCLYPTGQLCQCRPTDSNVICQSLGAWDAAVPDVAPDLPMDSGSVKPACLSDVVSSTCDPSAQRYCTMPNGRELCECRNGSWTCSAGGCPVSPDSQTACPAGQDMMCNATGSNVCICQASGYFLCGSI
jgi:hypothetical protein